MNLSAPKNWKTVRLGSVSSLISGYSFSSSDFSSGGTPVIKLGNITNGRVNTDSRVNFSGDPSLLPPSVQVKHNDILIAMTGGDSSNLATAAGRVGIYLDDSIALLNQRVGKILPTDEINRMFLFSYISQDSITRYLANQSNGSAQSNLTVDHILDLEIPLPPLEEQQEIAALLGCLDDKIELLRAENKTLEAMAQALFREWFVEFRYPGYEKVKMVDGVPEGWKAGNVYDLMKIQYGFPFKSEFFNENRNGLPLIRIRDLKDGDPSIYTNEVCGEEYIIKRGDIVAGMDAEFRPCIWKGENGVLNQRVCKFISKDESISNYFIYQVIKPHLEFFERTKGGTTVSHLGKADLDSIELLIPPKNILVSFSGAIDSSHKKLVNNFSEIQTLSKLRDELLDKIFAQ